MKKFTIRIALALLLILLLPQGVSALQFLVPVGQVIGLELSDNNVVVAAFDEALGSSCQKAGLRVGDRIIDINGHSIAAAEDIRQVLAQSDGTVDVSIVRGNKTKHLHLTPEITPEGPRLGVYLKQGVTGVGTVTWYDPQSGRFGALGHGVNDQDGGLLQMRQGNAYATSVISVKKGQSGAPGQLLGALKADQPIGSLTKNTDRGVFGTAEQGWEGEKMPVGQAKDIHTGQAMIRSTISGNTVREYSVEILKIYPNARSGGRNMLLQVTDPALLNVTGGIVQGMSGSPIIQDGKFIGAVTHVLINDPTTGYGIFIENMLDAAA